MHGIANCVPLARIRTVLRFLNCEGAEMADQQHRALSFCRRRCIEIHVIVALKQSAYGADRSVVSCTSYTAQLPRTSSKLYMW